MLVSRKSVWRVKDINGKLKTITKDIALFSMHTASVSPVKFSYLFKSSIVVFDSFMAETSVHELSPLSPHWSISILDALLTNKRLK